MSDFDEILYKGVRDEYFEWVRKPAESAYQGVVLYQNNWFLKFFTHKLKKFKLLISALESAKKTAQFSLLKFFSTLIGKHRSLYLGAHNVNFNEKKNVEISLINKHFWMKLFN